ncbi:MAG: alpha/beta hydrolase [Croceibacterium sp.]
MIHRFPGLAPVSLAAIAAATLALGACTAKTDDKPAAAATDASTMTSATDASAAPPPEPVTAKTVPPKASADMQAVLDALDSLKPAPLTTITPAAARAGPSFADAYAKVAQAKGVALKTDAVTTTDASYGSGPDQRVRVYRPAGTTAEVKLPVVVYYHGGGWVIANLDVYDAAPRAIAERMKAVVVSVEYRHAPEAKFPAQHEDAAAAYKFVLDNAAKWGGDVNHLAVLGESAGGNLAVATSIYARDKGWPLPDHIVAVYPIANTSETLPSRTDSAQAKPLNTAALNWFGYYYMRTKGDAQDPRLNLVAAKLAGLPATTIINAQADPLRSDGETLAEAMRNAGMSVEQRTFPGTTHEFFGMDKVVKAAREAQDYAIKRMRGSLN